MAITDKDVDKLKTVFATNDALLMTESRLEARIGGVEKELKVFKNETISRLDKLLSEAEKAREDRVFAKAKDDEQDQRLDEAEKDVKNVKMKVGV